MPESPDQNNAFSQLLDLFRVAFNEQIVAALRQNLRTDKERAAYAASDGTATTREVAQKAGIGSNSTVAALWKKWSQAGLVQRMAGGRYRARISIHDYHGLWDTEATDGG